MLGRLLEISVHAPDPLKQLGTFQALGFHDVPVGDVWSHRYAVVSDGFICIGLHEYPFESPSLTFVQSDLDRWVEAYRVQSIELAFEKLEPDSFNEIGFVEPGGLMITVLESRTFSPPDIDDNEAGALGELRAIELPCRDRAKSDAFWSQLGREADSGRLPASNLTLALGDSDALTLRYEGDPLGFAERALRAGVHGVSVASDELSARLALKGHPQIVVERTSNGY